MVNMEYDTEYIDLTRVDVLLIKVTGRYFNEVRIRRAVSCSGHYSMFAGFQGAKNGRILI